jgi:lysozyme
VISPASAGFLLRGAFMQMRYSKSGLHLTEQFEGLALKAYPDPGTGGAPWTIGYGHTGADVHPGLTWTQQQAEAALQRDIGAAQAHVNRACTRRDLTQDEFDALVDFAFNCGCRNLDGSKLMRLVNEGKFSTAADEFERWDRGDGRVMAGLLRRRLAERAEFLS